MMRIRNAKEFREALTTEDPAEVAAYAREKIGYLLRLAGSDGQPLTEIPEGWKIGIQHENASAQVTDKFPDLGIDGMPLHDIGQIIDVLGSVTLMAVLLSAAGVKTTFADDAEFEEMVALAETEDPDGDVVPAKTLRDARDGNRAGYAKMMMGRMLREMVEEDPKLRGLLGALTSGPPSPAREEDEGDLPGQYL